MNTPTISTNIINLEHRKDRLQHALSEFENKKEFNIEIIKAQISEKGNDGLWNTLIKIITTATEKKLAFVLIIEDDHQFTKQYSSKLLQEAIYQADILDVELLSGGIAHFNIAVPVTKNLFWVDEFWCTQFIIVFNRAYDLILNYQFKEGDTVDGILSKLLLHKLVIFPFISIQKDFGYSDITLKNSPDSSVISKHFQKATTKMNALRAISERYRLPNNENDLGLF